MLSKVRVTWCVRATPKVQTASGRQAGDVLPIEADTPAGRLVVPGDAVEESGLAGAVRSQQADDLALFHGRCDPVHSHQAAEALGNFLQFQQRHRATSFASAG